jgi:hypothetical protein
MMLDQFGNRNGLCTSLAAGHVHDRSLGGTEILSFRWKTFHRQKGVGIGTSHHQNHLMSVAGGSCNNNHVPEYPTEARPTERHHGW